MDEKSFVRISRDEYTVILRKLIERFNRLYREAVLDAYLFFNLYQVRQLTQEWMQEYNERRPQESLNNMTPIEWSNKILNSEKSYS